MKRKTIFDAARDGHDAAFTPIEPAEDDPTFQPTTAEPGCVTKMEVLRQRLTDGVPLWHPGDRVFEGSGNFVGKDGPGLREIHCSPRMEYLMKEP